MSKNKKKFNITNQTNTPKKELSPEELEKYKKIENIKERVKGKSLLILMPIYGNLINKNVSDFVRELMLIGSQIGVPVKDVSIADSLVQRSRNLLIELFMSTNFTHFLFLDADVITSPWGIFEMLAYQGEVDEETGDEYSVLGLLYGKKQLDLQKGVLAVQKGLVTVDNPNDFLLYSSDLVFNPIYRNDKKGLNLNKPVEVIDIGTGLLLSSRKVIEKLYEDNPDRAYSGDHPRTKWDKNCTIYNLFPVEVVENEIEGHHQKRLESEDYGFLRLCRKSGMKTYTLPQYPTKHFGNFAYNGSFMHLVTLFNKISDEYFTSFSGPLVKKPEKTSENL